MFKKILIANRGEIALRVLRACRELGIKTVAIHSDVDENAMHVRMADESICVGPASAQSSYLNIPAIITAATLTDADAIHPGYGFLSENQRFAEIIEEHNFKFIGPKSEHIKMMGNKIDAKKIMDETGVPTVKGVNDLSDKNMIEDFIKKVKYPIIVKAASGGGGKGMRIVTEEDDLNKAINEAKIEAKKSFNDEEVYLEKFLTSPKHIEIQVLCDSFGNVVTLGERDCSIQRKHQKLIEESPSSVLTNENREKISELCRKSMKEIGYEGVGTLEFLYENNEFYFMEMNTRLQVEHPITELTTGLDLVEMQLRIADGQDLPMDQKQVSVSGHAIEARLYSEDPRNEFLPSSGILSMWQYSEVPNIRVDSGVSEGQEISYSFDPMLAKIVAYGDSRKESICRLEEFLINFSIAGIKNNRDLLIDILKKEDFLKAKTNTAFLSQAYPVGIHLKEPNLEDFVAVVVKSYEAEFSHIQEKFAAIPNDFKTHRAKTN